MTVLQVPAIDFAIPGIRVQVAEWMEASLVFGPGDLRGQPYRLDDEKRGLPWRLCEVQPKGHPQAGRVASAGLP